MGTLFRFGRLAVILLVIFLIGEAFPLVNPLICISLVESLKIQPIRSTTRLPTYQNLIFQKLLNLIKYFNLHVLNCNLSTNHVIRQLIGKFQFRKNNYMPWYFLSKISGIYNRSFSNLVD